MEEPKAPLVQIFVTPLSLSCKQSGLVPERWSAFNALKKDGTFEESLNTGSLINAPAWENHPSRGA